MSRPITCYWCSSRKYPHCRKPKCKAIAGVYRYQADHLRDKERDAATWDDNAMWIRRRFAILHHLESLRKR